jgi:hypothetical protein
MRGKSTAAPAQRASSVPASPPAPAYPGSCNPAEAASSAPGLNARANDQKFFASFFQKRSAFFLFFFEKKNQKTFG